MWLRILGTIWNWERRYTTWISTYTHCALFQLFLFLFILGFLLNLWLYWTFCRSSRCPDCRSTDISWTNSSPTSSRISDEMIEATLYSTFKVQNRWLKTHTHINSSTQKLHRRNFELRHTHTKSINSKNCRPRGTLFINVFWHSSNFWLHKAQDQKRKRLWFECLKNTKETIQTLSLLKETWSWLRLSG